MLYFTLYLSSEVYQLVNCFQFWYLIVGHLDLMGFLCLSAFHLNC